MVFNLRKAQYFYFIIGLFDMAMHLMHISQAPRYDSIGVARVRFTLCKNDVSFCRKLTEKLRQRYYQIPNFSCISLR